METPVEPSWERPTGWTCAGLPFDLRALRYVLAAAEHLSFSGAANALGARVSSVSRRVRDFEDEIGVALFERTAAGVRPTDAGERFLSEIVPALHQVEAALHNAFAAGRVEHGTLRIGLITTLAGGPLRHLVSQFRRNYPGVQMELQDAGRRDHLRAIRARRLDVAFFIGNTALADCDILELWSERVHVAVGQDHALAGAETVSWTDLRDEKFLVTLQESGPEIHDYIIRRVSNYSSYPDVAHHPVTQETLLHLVALGEGVTLVSEGWKKVVLPGLVLHPLGDPEDVMPFRAVWSPQNDNPALRRFISFARALKASGFDNVR